MKTPFFYLITFLFAASAAQAADNPRDGHATHAEAVHNNESVTISIRQTDESLYDMPLYANFYVLTVEAFAAGAEIVKVSEFELKVFAWIRSSEDIPGGDAETFVEHTKDIPRQLVEIIREDPTVLDSCSNFSVALIGPP